MKAEIGMKIVRDTGFGYYVLIITNRTSATIATKHLNGSSSDHRAGPHNFRLYDHAKVERILQLEEEMIEKRNEQRELYQSLERIE